MRSDRFVFADLSNPRRPIVVKVKGNDGCCDNCDDCFHFILSAPRRRCFFDASKRSTDLNDGPSAHPSLDTKKE